MRKIKVILLVFILVVLLSPILQQKFLVIKSKPLTGLKNEYVLPHFSKTGFLECSYQDSLEKYLNEHIGFRADIIRTHNQLMYFAFNESKSPGVIVGKNDQFFIESYIENYTGKVYLGRKTLAETVRKIKIVQDSLKAKFNTDLVIVFAPGKASFYNEHLPRRFTSIKYPETHYTTYKNLFAENKINFLDLQLYFKTLKNSSPYLLYPKYGTHWSSYGVAKSADTIIKYIEDLKKINMPDMNYSQIEMSSEMKNTDYDIGILLNLIWSKKPEPMPYVTYSYKTDSSYIKPDVLAIGDSYWWSLVQAGIPAHEFKEDVFWDYGKNVLINNVKQDVYVNNLDFKKEVEKRDVIIIMTTEATLGIFPFDFIDKAYITYAATKEEKIEYWIKIINSVPEWIGGLKKESIEKGKNLEILVKEHATWWVESGH